MSTLTIQTLRIKNGIRYFLIGLILCQCTVAWGQETSSSSPSYNVFNLVRSPHADNPKYMKYNAFASKRLKKIWTSGDYEAADRAYIDFYYETGNLTLLEDLADLKYEIGDIPGANGLYDFAFKQWSINIKDRRAGWKYPFASRMLTNIKQNLTTGSPRAAIARMIQFCEEMGPDGPYHFMGNAFQQCAQAAFELRDRASLVKLHNLASLIKKGNRFQVDLSKTYFQAYVFLSILDQDYKTALDEIDEKLAKTKEEKEMAHLYKVILYTYMKDNEKAKEHANAIKLNNSIYNAMIANNEENYPEAIRIITHIFAQPLAKGTKIVNVYNYYATRATAYQGLGNLAAAKQDFEAALAFNPIHQESLDGMAELETRFVLNQQEDQTPPTISLVSPESQRGLRIVAATTEVLIKGKAIDDSAIKSVSINGQPVYFQASGDFWGGVQLKEGLNKVTIAAEDMAGNIAQQIFEVEKPVQTASQTTAEPSSPVKKGRNIALLIASQNYHDPQIPSLEKPIPDAIRLKLLLKNIYNFSEDQIVTIFNPDKSGFIQEFTTLLNHLQPEDNVVIFYAGHGIWREDEKKGYWLLADAQRQDPNTWLANQDVLKLIARLPALNILLITDSCFSGSVFRSRSIDSNAPQAIKQLSQQISRVAITSGNDTEVPDESVFMKHLIKALSENKEPYLSAQKLFVNHIIEAVMTETNTEPRYGTLESAGHIGGDYIFARQ